jgi:hypothetical protein
MAEIIQWNIRGLRANYSELQLLISAYNPAVICLQELVVHNSYEFCDRFGLFFLRHFSTKKAISARSTVTEATLSFLNFLIWTCITDLLGDLAY